MHMNTVRKKHIIENLSNLGTEKNTRYTNQEIVNHLKDLQRGIARYFIEKTNNENFRNQDIMIHFEPLAKKYGLDKTDAYKRFKSNMRELSQTIGSLINGINGEKDAKNKLKLLDCDDNNQILENVQLEDEDIQAEYDFIVIATYGMFVIEVKNWKGIIKISSDGFISRSDDRDVVYDFSGNMSVKEALLRKCLKEYFPTNYQCILYFPNEQSQLEGNYSLFPIVRGGGISYEIRSYNTNEEVLSKEEINKVADIIRSSQKDQRTICKVKCDEIIADYADLMAQIEECSKPKESSKQIFDDNVSTLCTWFKKIDWNIVLNSAIREIPKLALNMRWHRW